MSVRHTGGLYSIDRIPGNYNPLVLIGRSLTFHWGLHVKDATVTPPSIRLCGDADRCTQEKKNLGQGLVTSTLKTVAKHEIELQRDPFSVALSWGFLHFCTLLQGFFFFPGRFPHSDWGPQDRCKAQRSNVNVILGDITKMYLTWMFFNLMQVPSNSAPHAARLFRWLSIN